MSEARQNITFAKMRAAEFAGSIARTTVAAMTAISGDPKSKVVQTGTGLRAYRAPLGVRGLPMDIVERFYIAAAALGFLLIAAMALL
jgi:hypothetical protein